MPSSSDNALPPSSSSKSSRLITRSAMASFTSPSFQEPTPPSGSRLRAGFSVERIYEFEAPQFYDFTKQSDPERANLDENWFDLRRGTPSSPDFHFIARTSSSTVNRPKSASGKLCHKGNFSGSNGGLSFMNTPVGRGQNFVIPSSVGGDIRSSASFNPRVGLKKSATTENITNCLLSDVSSSDPPSTIIRSAQKRFREFGSDERKIISGFMSTPLLVIKTPNNSGKDHHHHLPRSPLQKITKKSNLGLFATEGSTLLVGETSSIEEYISIKSNETICIEETDIICNTDHGNMNVLNSHILSSTDCSIPNTSVLTNVSLGTTINTSITSIKSTLKNKEYETFQAGVKARILEERERIKTQAALQARRIQKLKAGPTHLPVKSTKPLTIPKSFQLGCDERAQLKKLQQPKPTNNNPTSTAPVPAKVNKPPISISHKFVPTIPKSPLFPSKLRAASKSNELKDNKDTYNNENHKNNSANIIDLRRKFEYRPTANNNNVTIPKSPKLSSIHRNRSNK